MLPGFNDNPRNTGAFPKSNRRSDRNRERDRSFINQWIDRPLITSPQNSNNLFQLDWHPVSERPTTTTVAAAATASTRTAKKSNTRYGPEPGAASGSAPAYDLSTLGSYNSQSRLYPNTYFREGLTPWLKMTSPIDSRTQSPPNYSTKPTNTDKMPERSHVEGRLNQIRDYITATSVMMESLSHLSDPRAQVQHEKLSRMVEDLYDSEKKLSNLMEDCQKYWNLNEQNGELDNGASLREQELRKKVEQSQRKLSELQDHQAHLMDIQLHVRERLNEARQAQQEHQNLLADMRVDERRGENDSEEQQRRQVNTGNVEQLERETEALRDKLQQLENKKRHMDHLVQELQAVELIERASCSSENSRPASQRDKVAELETMKAQLSHLKALMDEATRGQDLVDAEPPERDESPATEDIYHGEENGMLSNSFNESEDNARLKRSEPPTVEQIQAVTKELKEQQQMLLAARAELQRLKQQGSSDSQAPPPSVTSSTPPPTVYIEKKLSNNDVRCAQNKRRQIEDFMRKDQAHGSCMSSHNGVPDWGSRRDSNSLHSHTSTPGNLWPPPANMVAASHDHNVDNISVAENLLEVGSQPPLENGFPGNFWSMPAMMANQPPQGAAVGSAEYYRQLLLGSQSQQLQMMSTTIQQCCQLLWAQQREMQSMKSAITQLQNQLRLTQPHPINNLNIHEEPPSNLGRPQSHFGSLDAAAASAQLPPSSSLPNLVTLPGSCAVSSATALVATSNCQQQPPQLNNQVPPGNRANNYWDNFRSYSRQNLLSGSTKTITDCAASASSHLGTNANGMHTNKCNRPQCLENVPSDVHYSLNLQPQQHSAQLQQQQQQQQLQQQQQPQPPQDGSGPLRNNYEIEFPTLQQSMQQSESLSHNEPGINFKDDESSARIARKISKRDDLKLILMHCLKALESKRTDSPLPSSNLSNNNSTDSSDDESESGTTANLSLQNNGPVNVESNVAVGDVVTEPSSTTQDNVAPNLPGAFSNGIAAVTSSLVSSTLENGAGAIQNDPVDVEPLNNRVFKNDSPNSKSDRSDCECSNASALSAGLEASCADFEENIDYVVLDRAQSSPTNQWSSSSSTQ